MDFAAGLSIAYLKILSLAAVIMAFVWGAAKAWLVVYEKRAHQEGSGEAPPPSPGSSGGSA